MKANPQELIEVTREALGELLIDVYNRGRKQGRREVEGEIVKCRNCGHKIIRVLEAQDWVHVETFDGRKLVGACEPDMQSTWATR